MVSLDFFFLMMRRPPRSTLFPCTTLCRSVPGPDLARRPPADLLRAALARDVGVPVQGIGGQGHREGRQDPVDRKSTRLNSSHANISYAVFCLKKKNDLRASCRCVCSLTHL